MSTWLRRTALVAGVGLVICLVTSVVVGFGASVDLMGLFVRVEAVGLVAPGALAVLLAVLTDPVPPHVGRASNMSMSRWTVGTFLAPTPPLDAETGRTIVRQNTSLFAGGVVLIVLGVAVALS